jgi:hypothetical protein
MPKAAATVYVDANAAGAGAGTKTAPFRTLTKAFASAAPNAIVWVAGLEVPPGGVRSKAATLEELEANQDYPRPEQFDRGQVEEILKKWREGTGGGK